MLQEFRAMIIQCGRQTAHFSWAPTPKLPISRHPLRAIWSCEPYRSPCSPLLRASLRHLRPFTISRPGLRRPITALARPSTTRADDEEIPFNDYTPEANAAYWSTRPITVMKRMLEVSSTLGVWVAAGRLGSASPEERAERLRHILTKLGPAYIKIGQAVSSRPDVMGPEAIRELEKLQDRLPPFPTDQALALIEEDMGRPVTEIFSSISEVPIAAASLGQVYRATLRRDGSSVAVKVQRPGVKSAIALDVLVLRQLLAAVRSWRKMNSDLPALLDEWAASLFKELDYCQEARNGVKFGELYSHLDGVYVPKMVTDLTTPRVLIMEWIEGERLRTAYSAVSSNDGAGPSSPDDLRLVEIGVKCSLEQLLEYGFYHADPHPGNLIRTPDGKLAYLDFGMMGQVSESIRQGLIRATLHLVNREYEALADDFVTLGMLPKDSDKAKIVPALTSVFAAALAGGVNNLSFGALSANLGRTMYEFSFQIPPYYTLLVRSLSVLEGIALASDPNYKVLGAAYPWVARRLLTDTTPELRATLLSLLYKEGRFNFKRMESLLTQAARPTGRPQRRRDDPEGTEPPRGDALALVLSPRGEFVRGIVVEELAKGADAAWRLATDAAIDSARGQIATAAASGPLLTTMLDVLATVPKIANEEDAEQVDGIRRLGLALQAATIAQAEADRQRAASGGTPSASSTWMPDSSAGNGSSKAAGDQDPCTVAMANLEAAAELLQWALREAETLSPAERTEALKLPLEVAQAASSRVIARVVRWILVDEEESDSSSSTTARSSSSGVGENPRRSAQGGSGQGARPAPAAV